LAKIDSVTCAEVDPELQDTRGDGLAVAKVAALEPQKSSVDCGFGFAILDSIEPILPGALAA
jgi:hypothetical protein